MTRRKNKPYDKRGAKSKIGEWTNEDGLLRIRGWARDGYTNQEIATKCIGISQSTFYLWMTKNPEIVEAIKQGREPFVEKLEDALYKAALGYEYEETIEEITVNEAPDPEAQGSKRKHIRKYKKHRPPDAALLIFALKNLKKQKFKDHPIDDITLDDDPINRLLETLNKGAEQNDDSANTQPKTE